MAYATTDDPSLFGLRIHASDIHGLGVFADKKFKKNTKIVPYTHTADDIMSWKDFKAKYGDDFRYTYSMRRVNKVICTKENKNIINYVNHSDVPTAYLKAKSMYAYRDIKKGEEIVLTYPQRYITW
jgi:SET domain-containing protein